MNRNLKSLIPKLSPAWKRIFSLLGGVGITILSLFIYSFFRSQQNPSLPPQPIKEELPEPVVEEVPRETNQSIDYQQANQYFCRIVEEIHEETIHVCGEPVPVELKTAAERTTGTPYLLCQVKSCLSTTPQKKCEHKNYLDCPHSDCAFFGTEQRQFYDYCAKHTCQSYDCRQLVVNYEDGCWDKYCLTCLPNSNFLTPYES